MSKPKRLGNCGICRRWFGRDQKPAYLIPRYRLVICRGCYACNWDGWGPCWEDTLERHLQVRGVEIPERNEKGWYPRGD